MVELAMHFAREGMTDELAGFVDHGLPVDVQDDDGNTPLMLAAYHGHAPTVRMLVRHGADVDLRNHRDQSPVAGAIFKGEDEVVRVLPAAGCRPRRRPAHGAPRPREMFGGRTCSDEPRVTTRPRRRRRQRGRLPARRLVARASRCCGQAARTPVGRPTRRTTRSCWCSRARPRAACPRGGTPPAHRPCARDGDAAITDEARTLAIAPRRRRRDHGRPRAAAARRGPRLPHDEPELAAGPARTSPSTSSGRVAGPSEGRLVGCRAFWTGFRCSGQMARVLAVVAEVADGLR